MKTFGEKKAAFERLGWHVSLVDEYRGEPGVDRKTYDLDLFSSVRLPLTGQDWCRLCMGDDAEGCPALAAGEQDENGEELYYVPAAYGWSHGELKEARRILRGWFYEGGHVDIDELVRFGEFVAEHGDDYWPEGTNPFKAPTPKELDEYVEYGIKSELSPIGKIAICYHLTKDHYLPKVPEAQHERRDELKGAFHLVHSMAWVFGMGDFFTDRSYSSATTDRANDTMRLRRFVPALKLVYERVKDLVPDPIEGWALVDLDQGEGEVAENGLGYCIYATKVEAERLLEQWREGQRQHEDECCTPRRLRDKPIDERIKIRAVRVSLEKGIEFLDEGAEPRPRVKWKRKPSWYETETEDLQMLFDQYCETRVFLCQKDREKHHRYYDEAWYAWQEAAKFFGDLED